MQVQHWSSKQTDLVSLPVYEDVKDSSDVGVVEPLLDPHLREIRRASEHCAASVVRVARVTRVTRVVRVARVVGGEGGKPGL